MNKNILLIISFLLDLLLFNIISYTRLTLVFTYPMLFIICFLCCLLSTKKINLISYVIFIIGSSCIYNNIFISILIMGFIYLFSSLINKYFRIKKFLIIPVLFLFIVVFQTMLVFILQIINYLNVSINEVIYIIIHSLNINLIYGLILYLILTKKGSKKGKKLIRINR